MSATVDRGGLGEKIVSEMADTDAPFVTAAELSDRLGASRQSVHYRLEKLHEAGRVERKRAGSRAVGWWLVT